MRSLPRNPGGFPLPVLAAVAGTVMAAVVAISAVTDHPHSLGEDEPGWDCRLHGNRTCGASSASCLPPGDHQAPDGGTFTVVPDGRDCVSLDVTP